MQNNAWEIDNDATKSLKKNVSRLFEGEWEKFYNALIQYNLDKRMFQVSLYTYPNIYDNLPPNSITIIEGGDELIDFLRKVKPNINWKIEIINAK